ncbi:MAG: hypothetical protein ABW215_11345 [Kibdelosporangium sp.]
MAVDEEVWLSVLREHEVRGGEGWDNPLDFNRTAAQARFDRLAERLSETFARPFESSAGPKSDSAGFGDICIPAEFTRTRTKRTREPRYIRVSVSTYGYLATYGTVGHGRAPIHKDDTRRIEEAFEGLDYVIVPERVLALPYDGIHSPECCAMSWYDRFFGFL